MIIDDLVRGSIDMHCHHAPDAMIEGRMDALETVKKAREMGMRTLREDGLLKIASGMTTLEEVLRATMGDDD